MPYHIFLWIFVGFTLISIIGVGSFKDARFKLLSVMALFVALLGLFSVVVVQNKGNPITSLPHGKTFTVICSQQLNEGGVDYAILYLAGVRTSDKSLGKSLEEPKFYKIETWRLRDRNKQRIYEIPFVFEVLVFTDSIINENADKPWLKVQEQTLYCLIPPKF